MLSISDKNQADAVKSFNYTSRKLDDLLNIDNHYFEQMVSQIYPIELQLNKTNYFYTEAPFLDFDLSNLWHTIYDKRMILIFKHFLFHFWMEMVIAPFGVYILQLIRFARVYSTVSDFNKSF